MRRALALQPDILLPDLEMPQPDGVETIRRLRQQQPNSRIIVFTAFDNDERIIHAVQAGANGYLLKEAPRDEIFSAIRITMAGGSLLQPVVASKLLRHMGNQPLTGSPATTYSKTTQPTLPFEPLTERELEVLKLLAQVIPHKAISAQLIISERTDKLHISSIMGT